MNGTIPIRFPVRSKFLEPLRQGIIDHRHRLDQGQTIEIILDPGGYDGRWFVIINPDDRRSFQAEGTLTDPTRFPQRIRAAALALDQEGLHGRYLIRHDCQSGVVSISQG